VVAWYLCIAVAGLSTDSTIGLRAVKQDTELGLQFLAYHTCIQRFHYGGHGRNIGEPFGVQKTRMVWLPVGEIFCENIVIHF